MLLSRIELSLIFTIAAVDPCISKRGFLNLLTKWLFIFGLHDSIILSSEEEGISLSILPYPFGVVLVRIKLLP